ncbi:MAG: hypothetical protein QW707_05580 [Candidatus Bathyarchaeia archaeon]
MPPKHPLLFSVLALFLAVMLFSAALIEVHALAWFIVLGIGVALGLGLGIGVTWYYYNYVASRPETPGVNLDSYVAATFDSWAVLWKNTLHTIDYLSSLLDRYDLYFIRRAEYGALDYLHQPNMSEKAMKEVVKELCTIQANFARNLYKVLGDLDRTATATFVGDASNYEAFVKADYTPITVVSRFHHSYDFETGFRIYYKTTSKPVVVWDCERLTYFDGEANNYYEIEKYVVIGAQGSICLDEPSPGGYCYTDIAVHKRTYSPFRSISLIYGDDSFRAIMNRVITRIAGVYDLAKSFALAYHQGLRSMGYFDKSQVPSAFLCPPPDIMFYDVNELAKKVENYGELAKLWLAYLNSIGDEFDVRRGCLAGGSVTAITTTYATTYTTVISGQTTTITTTVQTTYTYTNTTVTTITTTINGTPTTYVTTITNTYTWTGPIPTTITTVIGGQTTTIVTTQTGIAYVTPAGVYVPNIFTKLWNVTITIPGGSPEYVSELVLLDTTADITFTAGECTKLPASITAMVSYPDGRVRVTLYPTNTTICPGKIIAPGGQEVSSYTYQEKPLDEWVTERYQLESPTFVETKDKLGQLIELIIMIIPLILVVTLVGAIRGLAEGRWYRFVSHEKMRVKA